MTFETLIYIAISIVTMESAYFTFLDWYAKDFMSCNTN